MLHVVLLLAFYLQTSQNHLHFKVLVGIYAKFTSEGKCIGCCEQSGGHGGVVMRGARFDIFHTQPRGHVAPVYHTYTSIHQYTSTEEKYSNIQAYTTEGEH